MNMFFLFSSIERGGGISVNINPRCRITVRRGYRLAVLQVLKEILISSIIRYLMNSFLFYLFCEIENKSFLFANE